jgi:hypothetical protein
MQTNLVVSQSDELGYVDGSGACKGVGWRGGGVGSLNSEVPPPSHPQRQVDNRNSLGRRKTPQAVIAPGKQERRQQLIR